MCKNKSYRGGDPPARNFTKVYARDWRKVALAAVAVVIMPAAAGAYPEFWNGFFSYPTTQDSTDFEVMFTGNQTSLIDLPSSSDTNLDPWGNGTVTQSYNGNTALTTVSFNGTSSDPPFAQSISGQPNGVVHFGLATTTSGGAGVGWATFAGAYWTGDTAGATTGPSEPVMALQPVFPTPTSGANFVIWFLEATARGVASSAASGVVAAGVASGTTGQWFEFPISPGTTPSFILSNPNQGTIMAFNDTGYFISPTQIPLDSLNWPGEPPPGQPGSPFITLPNPPSLGAGASETITTPEPAVLALMVLGGAALLLIRRRHTPLSGRKI